MGGLEHYYTFTSRSQILDLLEKGGYRVIGKNLILPATLPEDWPISIINETPKPLGKIETKTETDGKKRYVVNVSYMVSSNPHGLIRQEQGKLESYLEKVQPKRRKRNSKKIKGFKI